MACRKDGCHDGGFRRIGNLLRGEDHIDVFFAQGFQPVLQLPHEDRVLEKEPCLIENEQGRPSVEPLFNPVKEIEESRNHDLGTHAHQCVHLNGQPVAILHGVGIGIEDFTVVALH